MFRDSRGWAYQVPGLYDRVSITHLIFQKGPNMNQIEKRGRTFDALFNPKHYTPFPGIGDADKFRAVWRNHPDCVFANMAHAAYVDDDCNQVLFGKLGAAVKSYASEPNSFSIIRGRQAILVHWDRVAVLSFRGTEGSEQLAIPSPEFLRRVADAVGIELPEKFNMFLAMDILDDLNVFQVPYSGIKREIVGNSRKLSSNVP